jgi:hypothetical protein
VGLGLGVLGAQLDRAEASWAAARNGSGAALRCAALRARLARLAVWQQRWSDDSGQRLYGRGRRSAAAVDVRHEAR